MLSDKARGLRSLKRDALYTQIMIYSLPLTPHAPLKRQTVTLPVPSDTLRARSAFGNDTMLSTSP